MFTNLSYSDKQAFFALLDEYFESRPHLRPGGGDGAPAAAGGPPAVSMSSKPGSRPTPPPVPSSRGSGASASPARDTSPPRTRTGSVSSAGSGAPAAPTRPAGRLGQERSAMQTHLGKANTHVSSALGKVGAGSLASKFGSSSPSTFKPTGNVPTERTLPPAPVRAGGALPPPVRSGGTSTPGGLTTSKGFGHVDTSSGGQAFKTMWRDPHKVEQATANIRQEPALPKTYSAVPPPLHHGGAEPAPEYNGAGRARAEYDFEGGDATDLPLQAGQIVTIVAKTSDDWWTCQDANGKQGLVPANYMTEM